MQLTPPGTPLAQVTGGTAIALSSPPANAVDASKANISPATKMGDILRMGLILPWPRNSQGEADGPSYLRLQWLRTRQLTENDKLPRSCSPSTQHQPLDLTRFAGRFI